jgi:hypothetical protein
MKMSARSSLPSAIGREQHCDIALVAIERGGQSVRIAGIRCYCDLRTI